MREPRARLSPKIGRSEAPFFGDETRMRFTSPMLQLCKSCITRVSACNIAPLHILPSYPKSLEKNLGLVYDIVTKEAGKHIANYTK